MQNANKNNLKINNKNFKEGIIKNRTTLMITILMLLGALFLSMVFAIVFGPVDIKALEVLKIILHNAFNISIGDTSTLSSGVNYEIIWSIRFPRILLGAIVGMGLSVVGLTMQSMVQNPLADPYILGISSGASLGATFGIFIGIGSIFGANGVSMFAFMGALGSSLLVYVLSNTGGRATPVKLVLSGMVISSIASAFSSFLIFMCKNDQQIRTITFWLMGSLASASWDSIKLPGIFIILGTLFFVFQFRNLNIMLLGDQNAITLGTDLNKYRKIYMLITSLMTGLIVYSAGMIGFVGLVIPHIVRMLVGSDHRKLVPICALVGAIFLIWTDVLARTLLQDMEIPIGVITSILGAPFFIWIMIKKTNAFGGN